MSFGKTREDAVFMWNHRAPRDPWWNVTKVLPDDDITVILLLEDDEVTVGYLDAGEWFDHIGKQRLLNVAAWQDLPEAPVV